MTPAEAVIIAIEDAGRLSRQAEIVARAECSRQRSRAHHLEARRDAALAKAADHRVMTRLMGRILWVPVVRGAVIEKHRSAAEIAGRNADTLRLRSMETAARADALEAHVLQARRNAGVLQKAARAAAQLGQPPKRVEDSAINLSFQVRYLIDAQPGMHWLSQAAATSGAVIDLVKGWAKVRADAEVRTGAPNLPAPAVKRVPERKIFLPIPPSMWEAAQDLGASRDPKAAPGTSPFFVSSNQDFKPFRGLLPLAYRKDGPKFEFPPIPFRASGQNLWTFFDRSTWNRIRKVSYAETGHRCAICGGRGGFIADKVLGEDERRHGVECHEVWQWDVEDPATGVGIQRLDKLLVVCASCHSVFHSGYFANRAKDLGLEDEVRAHIENRRMLINRVSLDELNESLAASRDNLQRVAGVTDWIIDLEHLGKQQFMSGHIPILKERNDAGVGPERIAGIAFESDAGEGFAERKASDIYAELVAASEAYDQPTALPVR